MRVTKTEPNDYIHMYIISIYVCVYIYVYVKPFGASASVEDASSLGVHHWVAHDVILNANEHVR